MVGALISAAVRKRICPPARQVESFGTVSAVAGDLAEEGSSKTHEGQLEEEREE